VADAGANAPTAKESAVGQEYATAIGSQGFASLGHLLADDVTFNFPGAADATGRDAVVAAHERLFGAFDSRKVAPTRIFRTASEQMVEWTMSGVQSRDWMGVAPTQKAVSFRGLTVLLTKDDGTIAEVHVTFDVAAVKSLLGVAPKDLPLVRELPRAQTAAMPDGPPQIIDQTGKEADNVAVVRTALDALENTNEAAYLAVMADDVEVHTLQSGEPSHGKEERRAYFKAMHKSLSELDTTVINGWSVGSYAIVEYWIAGDQMGPIGWVPMQANHVVRLHVTDVDEVVNGRIAKIWRYENSAEALSPGP
jgi:ketosteroid isomerase-like protein